MCKTERADQLHDDFPVRPRKNWLSSEDLVIGEENDLRPVPHRPKSYNSQVVDAVGCTDAATLLSLGVKAIEAVQGLT